MKFEVDTPARLAAWLEAPRAAIFQSQDLRPHSAAIAAHDLHGCAFLGCRMAPVLEQAAAPDHGRSGGLPRPGIMVTEER